MKKASSRFVLVALFLLAGFIFYKATESSPREVQLVFILTDLEVSHNGSLLRHEQVKKLSCRVVDSSGYVVARIVHRTPGAVTRPPTINVPYGEYNLHISLDFQTHDGTTKQMNYLKQENLAASEVSVRP